MLITKLLMLLLPLIIRSDFINSPSTTLKVMTFNIRYNNPDDGENAWPVRKNYVVEMVKKNNIDILGIQEGLKDQVDYLSNELSDYGRIGIGRDDGKEAGEYSAVFYKKVKFEKLESNTFWLSQTPEKPGLGWDAVCNELLPGENLKIKIPARYFMFLILTSIILEKRREVTARC